MTGNELIDAWLKEVGRVDGPLAKQHSLGVYNHPWYFLSRRTTPPYSGARVAVMLDYQVKTYLARLKGEPNYE
jgi:hypothetical protein